MERCMDRLSLSFEEPESGSDLGGGVALGSGFDDQVEELADRSHPTSSGSDLGNGVSLEAASWPAFDEFGDRRQREIIGWIKTVGPDLGLGSRSPTPDRVGKTTGLNGPGSAAILRQRAEWLLDALKRKGICATGPSAKEGAEDDHRVTMYLRDTPGEGTAPRDSRAMITVLPLWHFDTEQGEERDPQRTEGGSTPYLRFARAVVTLRLSDGSMALGEPWEGSEGGLELQEDWPQEGYASVSGRIAFRFRRAATSECTSSLWTRLVPFDTADESNPQFAPNTPLHRTHVRRMDLFKSPRGPRSGAGQALTAESLAELGSQ